MTSSFNDLQLQPTYRKYIPILFFIFFQWAAQGLFLPCIIIPEKKPKFFVYHINMYTNINSLQLEEFEFGGLLEVSIVWVDDYFILIMIFAFSLIKFFNQVLECGKITWTILLEDLFGSKSHLRYAPTAGLEPTTTRLR